MDSIKKSGDRTYVIIYGPAGIHLSTSPFRTGVVSPETDILSFEAQKSALHDLKMHIDGHIVTLARRRNSRLPLNRLPPELVSDILIEVVPSGDIPELQKLAQVQIVWRDIILSNARFWTHLDLEESLETIALKLRRSKNSPLDIGDFAPEDYDFQPFYDLIAPHAHRWRAFSFWECPLEIVRASLETPLPMMERLMVLGDGKGPTFLNLIGGPRLRHVHIGAFEIPFQSGVLSNLLSLCISHIADTALMWVLPGILRGCPDLQEFTLRFIEHRTAEVMELSRPLILPHLTQSHLCNVATSLSSPLLRFLRPNDRCFHTAISDRNAVDALETLDLLLSPRDNTPSIFQSMFAEPWPSVNVTFRDGTISIFGLPLKADAYLDGPRETHEIQLHIDCWPSMTGEWRHRFPFTSPSFPNVKLHYRGIANAEAEDAIFDFLPTVNCLVLGSTLSRATRIVQKLLEPKVEGGWRWPRLERVEINVWVDPEVEGGGSETAFLRGLKDLVEMRNSTGGVTVSLNLSCVLNKLTQGTPFLSAQVVSRLNDKAKGVARRPPMRRL